MHRSNFSKSESRPIKVPSKNICVLLEKNGEKRERERKKDKERESERVKENEKERKRKIKREREREIKN